MSPGGRSVPITSQVAAAALCLAIPLLPPRPLPRVGGQHPDFCRVVRVPPLGIPLAPRFLGADHFGRSPLLNLHPPTPTPRCPLAACVAFSHLGEGGEEREFVN